MAALSLLALLTAPAFSRGIGAIYALPLCDAVRDGMAVISITVMAGYVGIRYRLRRA